MNTSKNIANCLNRKKIILLGAGASFGARVNFEKQLPLGNNLVKWLKEKVNDLNSIYHEDPLHLNPIFTCNYTDIINFLCLEAKRILEPFSEKCNFEKMIKWIEKEDRISVQRMLQLFFSDQSSRQIDFGFNTAKDGYDDLIAKLNLEDPSYCIISLNYDVLFEEALTRNKINYTYPYTNFFEGKNNYQSNGLAIYKPHGSINFFAIEDPNIHFSHEPTSEELKNIRRVIYIFYGGDRVLNLPIYYPITDSSNILLEISEERFPIMANYTSGKNAENNILNLIDIRSEALTCFNHGSELIIIGVNPIYDYGDDPFLGHLFTRSWSHFSKVSFVYKESEDDAQKQKMDIDIMKHKNSNTCFFKGGLSQFIEEYRIR